MNTAPKEFEKFYKLIPKKVRDTVWFFPIRANSKLPECQTGTILKLNDKYRLSYSESVTRLKWGSNVGIYAIKDGLMFLDLDVSQGKLIASQSVLDALELNPTLTLKTRNGGLQKYYLNDGKYANQLIKVENGVVIGELRTDWFYVVSPGSHVSPDEHCYGEVDGTYRIIQECPIAQFQPLQIELKLKEQIFQNKSIVFEHEKPENCISAAQHLIDLESLGIRQIRRMM